MTQCRHVKIERFLKYTVLCSHCLNRSSDKSCVVVEVHETVHLSTELLDGVHVCFLLKKRKEMCDFLIPNLN